MIFGYNVPWDLAMWTWGYTTFLSLGCRRSDFEVSQKAGAVDLLLRVKGQASPELVKSSGGTWFPRFGKGDSRHRLLRRLSASFIRSIYQIGAHCCNPVLVALGLGCVVGVFSPLRNAFFGRGGLLGVVGDALKQVGAPAPMMGMQILSGTMGCTLRQFWDTFKGPAESRALLWSRVRSLSSWMMLALAGKLVILPTAGGIVISAICALRGSGLDGHGIGMAEGSAANASGSESELFPTPAEGLLDKLWPENEVLRAVVVMEWSAPSCLAIIVFCHRIGLEEAAVQAVAVLYLSMYVVTVVSTTFWVTAGLAIF